MRAVGDHGRGEARVWAGPAEGQGGSGGVLQAPGERRAGCVVTLWVCARVCVSKGQREGAEPLDLCVHSVGRANLFSAKTLRKICLLFFLLHAKD